MERYLVTSALPYIHGIPHLGNLVGSILPADVFFKFLNIYGKEAIFICGSDEHGAQMEIDAIKNNTTPQSIADTNHEIVKGLLEKFGCTFTFYGRTGSKENEEKTIEIFNALFSKGLIIEKEEELPYCEHDARFLPDRFVEGKCPYCGGLARGDQCDDCGKLLTPKQLIEPRCKICGNPVVFKSTKNLFLDLTPVKKDLEEWVKSSQNWTKNTVNSTLEFLKNLEPRAITRDLNWGFRVPVKGYENKRFYVWFDAPIGYIGITQEWINKTNNKELTKDINYWWKDRDTKIIQFMGKDNIVFHTVFFPGCLIGSKLGYQLPSAIIAFEFLTAKGTKFSKSRGKGLNIQSALEILPADYWRYVLISLLPETSDSEFSFDLLQKIINTELNDQIGNFVYRTLVFIVKQFDSKVPEAELGEDSSVLMQKVREKEEEYIQNFLSYKMREALKNVLEIAILGNTYLSSREPWKNKSKSAETLFVSANLVRDISVLLYPFTPESSLKLRKMLGLNDAPKIEEIKKAYTGAIQSPSPLFRKITNEEIEKIKEDFKG